MGINVACYLYKLVHGVKYLHCFELFAISKSTMHLVLQEFIFSIKMVLKKQIWWLEGKDLVEVMRGFRIFSNLAFIYSAIDVIQIHIQKPWGGFVGDYFSFKSKAYSLELQAMVDCQKKFHDVFVGLFGSINNANILHLSNLYKKAMNGNMFSSQQRQGRNQTIFDY